MTHREFAEGILTKMLVAADPSIQRIRYTEFVHENGQGVERIDIIYPFGFVRCFEVQNMGLLEVAAMAICEAAKGGRTC
jgi:hypothetical protein